jgi:hypothetical protein
MDCPEQRLGVPRRLERNLQLVVVQAREDLHRVAEMLRGNPHLVQLKNAIRLIDVWLEREEFPELRGNGPSCLSANRRRLLLDLTELGFRANPAAGLPYLLDERAARQPLQGFFNVPLQDGAALPQPKKEPRHARSAGWRPLFLCERLDEIDLNIGITRSAQCAAEPPRDLLPTLEFSGRQTVDEQREGGAEATRRHPHIVDVFDVRAPADAGDLANQRVEMFRDRVRAEKTITRIRRSLHWHTLTGSPSR